MSDDLIHVTKSPKDVINMYLVMYDLNPTEFQEPTIRETFLTDDDLISDFTMWLLRLKITIRKVRAIKNVDELTNNESTVDYIIEVLDQIALSKYNTKRLLDFMQIKIRGWLNDASHQLEKIIKAYDINL